MLGPPPALKGAYDQDEPVQPFWGKSESLADMKKTLKMAGVDSFCGRRGKVIPPSVPFPESPRPPGPCPCAVLWASSALLSPVGVPRNRTGGGDLGNVDAFRRHLQGSEGPRLGLGEATEERHLRRGLASALAVGMKRLRAKSCLEAGDWPF